MTSSPGSTDFARACKALEDLEHCLAKLTTPFGGVEVPSLGRARLPDAMDSDWDWVVIAGSTNAAQCQVSMEERTCFLEAEQTLALLEQLTGKMRRKCRAHAELEDVRLKLGQRLTDRPDDVISAAQSIKADSGEDSAELQSLLDRASQLSSVATYGAKMRERVLTMLTRFDAALAHFKGEIVPRLAAAVAAADVEEAERRRRAEDQAKDEEQLARQRALHPLTQLIESSEQKLQEMRENEEVAAHWHCVQSPSLSDLGIGESLLAPTLPGKARSMYS